MKKCKTFLFTVLIPALPLIAVLAVSLLFGDSLSFEALLSGESGLLRPLLVFSVLASIPCGAVGWFAINRQIEDLASIALVAKLLCVLDFCYGAFTLLLALLLFV